MALVWAGTIDSRPSDCIKETLRLDCLRPYDINCEMRVRSTPRYQGKITSWKDEQGFGFITPNGGGPAVFVHIKSFSHHGRRPAADNMVSYELTANEKGQPRAENVAFVRAGAPRQVTARTSGSALITAFCFLVLMAIAVLAGKLPAVVFGAYICLSVVTFIAYAVDKSAARHDRWRTKESTLHLLALAGGWPGALVAQQLLRHKSKKESFRMAFWLTVLVNCGALGWFLSSSGAGLLQSVRTG
jgi:uncharacterized membrane protein YsdA (DUF1294 family)/cold shock CspA family protein